MKVTYIDDINNIKEQDKICLCLGYFDGLHLGHQELIKECIKVSKEKNLIPSLLTFDPSPNKVLNPEKFNGNINNIEQKIELLDKYGIQNVYILSFNKNIASLTKDEFINHILKPLNVNHIVCGFDFTYGYKGLGKGEDLKEFFEVSIVKEYLMDNEKVSTTRILKCLNDGDVKEAHRLLGYPYTIKGEVVHGLKNGKRIGYPTANIDDNGFYLPKNGVYACYTIIDGKKYKSMVNVGNHPTIQKLSKSIIESYIFDFNEEIYGKMIEISFIDYVRPEKNFNSVENLKNRLNLDTKLIANILK